jgi:type I restriction enzyme M protein
MAEKDALRQKTANHESIFQRNIQRAAEKGFISFSPDDLKITYHCNRDYTTSFKKPEEKVRASYFAELVLDYEYPKGGIKKWET